MARRTKTFSEGLARRFDRMKDYPGEPDNRTLENLLIVAENALKIQALEKKVKEKKK
jgi:hypothetical protein